MEHSNLIDIQAFSYKLSILFSPKSTANRYYLNYFHDKIKRDKRRLKSLKNKLSQM